MKPKTQAERIRAYLRKYPNANVSQVALKFNAAKPVVYKLRKAVWDESAALAQAPAPAEGQGTWTLTTAPGVGMVAVHKPAQGDITATLTERGTRYGKFKDHAEVTQQLKRIIFGFNPALRLEADQKEALEMIAHKLGRIINGDPDYADSWVDIAGYAKLVSDRLEGVER